MIRPRRRQILTGIVALAAIIAVAGYFVIAGVMYGSLAKLQSPQSLTLYSLDVAGSHPDLKLKTVGEFYDYPLLGKVEIHDASARKGIIRALKRSSALGRTQSFAKCFWPRHAIRAIESSHTIDVVICFQCRQAKVFCDGEYQSTEPITAPAKSLFNTYLTDAGVPLSPDEGQRE